MYFILHMLEAIGIHIPLVVGMFMTQRLLKIPDLSMETAYMVGGMSGCFLIPFLTAAPSLVAVVLLLGTSLIAGGIVGYCSSTITIRFGIAHLFSAIITAGIFLGAIYFCMNPYQGITGYTNHLIMIQNMGILPAVIIINILLFFVCALIMRSQFGYLAIAAGSNPHFFRLFGLSYATVFCSGVVFANALAGLSGYLAAQTMFFADVHMGLGKLLFALVAIMIGRLIIPSHRALIMVPLLGTTAQIGIQLLLMRVGFNLNYFSLVHAGVLLLLLAIAQRKGVSAFADMGLQL